MEFQFELAPRRPSKLLGKRFKFERSTALGLSPDTVLRALTGRSMRQMVEDLSYEHSLALVALGRSEATGSVLQKATLETAEEMFGSVTRDGKPLTLQEVRDLSNSLATPWRILRRSYGSAISPAGRKLLTRLAYYDRLMTQIAATQDAARNVAHRKKLFATAIHYWGGKGLGLAQEPILVLEASLQHLAWLDVVSPPNCTGWKTGTLLTLSEPSVRPMRHWFDLLLKRVRRKNLAELHDLLVERNAVRLDSHISHDRLKKWSSSQEPIAYESIKVLLNACVADAGHSPEVMALWAAKLLTMLTELIRCFSEHEMTPLDAQAHIHDRLQWIHQDMAANRGVRSEDLFLV